VEKVNANGPNLKTTLVEKVDANNRIQARYGGNRTLALESMARVLKSTLMVAQLDTNGRTQAHSGRTSRC
jgi:hypothetical protein